MTARAYRDQVGLGFGGNSNDQRRRPGDLGVGVDRGRPAHQFLRCLGNEFARFFVVELIHLSERRRVDPCRDDSKRLRAHDV